MSEAYPHLVQHNLSTRVGKRPSAASWPPAVISSLASPAPQPSAVAASGRRRSPWPPFSAFVWRGPLAPLLATLPSSTLRQARGDYLEAPVSGAQGRQPARRLDGQSGTPTTRVLRSPRTHYARCTRCALATCYALATRCYTYTCYTCHTCHTCHTCRTCHTCYTKW